MPLTVDIDSSSGFCFGVVKAVEKAETYLASNPQLYSLGDIVHNASEVQRLEHMGLDTLSPEKLSTITNTTVLFRAHGEPPASYQQAKAQNIQVIDATCPVVIKLQQRIQHAWESMKAINGQIVIYGKKGHPEVIGLLGQTNNEAILVETIDDLILIDFNRPIELFSQTTKSIDGFQLMVATIKSRLKPDINFVSHDTICRQVANRTPRMAIFAATHDVILFVGGAKSSNAQVLFSECKKANKQSYFINDSSDIDPNWFLDNQSVGVCGATSTPQWLLKQVADKVESLI